MAQHIIRDSKGRVDKILNDKEYAEYQKNGCYAKLIGFVIVAAIILFNVGDCEGDKKKGTASSHKTEITENATSSQSGVVPTISINSTINETVATTDEPTGSMSEDNEMSAGQKSEEYETSTEQAIESESSTDEAEQKLSRKERRALRKAKRKAEQELNE